MDKSKITYFLSVIFITKNSANTIEKIVKQIGHIAGKIADDYEIVIVDNGSRDETVYKLKSLTKENGEPNLQVYALSSQTEH